MKQNRLRTVGGKKRGFKERGEESWRRKKRKSEERRRKSQLSG